MYRNARRKAWDRLAAPPLCRPSWQFALPVRGRYLCCMRLLASRLTASAFTLRFTSTGLKQPTYDGDIEDVDPEIASLIRSEKSRQVSQVPMSPLPKPCWTSHAGCHACVAGS